MSTTALDVAAAVVGIDAVLLLSVDDEGVGELGDCGGAEVLAVET